MTDIQEQFLRPYSAEFLLDPNSWRQLREPSKLTPHLTEVEDLAVRALAVNYLGKFQSGMYTEAPYELDENGRGLSVDSPFFNDPRGLIVIGRYATVLPVNYVLGQELDTRHLQGANIRSNSFTASVAVPTNAHIERVANKQKIEWCGGAISVKKIQDDNIDFDAKPETFHAHGKLIRTGNWVQLDPKGLITIRRREIVNVFEFNRPKNK